MSFTVVHRDHTALTKAPPTEPETSRLHWIETEAAGRIAIAARPRAGEWLDIEIEEWKRSSIDIVVSLLEPDEISELGLHREAELCRHHAIEFISFPIADRGLPESEADSLIIARRLADFIREGKTVAIHCRAGIGRSSVSAASALICLGVEATDALARISASRGLIVPDTDEQRDWVIAFGENHHLGA